MLTHEVDLNKITVPHWRQFLFSLQLLSSNNLIGKWYFKSLTDYFSFAVPSAKLKWIMDVPNVQKHIPLIDLHKILEIRIDKRSKRLLTEENESWSGQAVGLGARCRYVPTE